MNFLGIDLGTTNIKVILYDEKMQRLAVESEAVAYEQSGRVVEFDAEAYFSQLELQIEKCCAQVFKEKPYPIAQIVLTGQAESLVVLDKEGKPLRKAISWMDMRSQAECEELKKQFDVDTCYHITGQPEIVPTWPVTKILWIKHNEKETVFDLADKYLLLKDYIVYRMSGRMLGDHSIYNFSHYFNITKKVFWDEILDYVGIRKEQLPETAPSCTVAGCASGEFLKNSGISAETKINIGTLDHFAGMIGTGNIHEGTVSESTGTVLALATLLEKPLFSEEMVALHCGPFPDTYVLLPVCESGGSSLEWFKRACMPNTSYDEMNQILAERPKPGKLLFVPYITGANSPDFNMKASGVFFGLRSEHDACDMALAVMEGVTHLLDKNIVSMEKAGIPIKQIVSTGGGAKSPLWCQMKADLTGKQVCLPKDKEAACLGAAMIGAVSEKVYGTFDDAVKSCIQMETVYEPKNTKAYEIKRKLYDTVYQGVQSAYDLMPATED